ncbi:MAG: HemK/PrmC family methyltransferase [Candidatus Daviesbacteria bacterium]|nr:HemK/PrmC family methyltransferase [Candidatus Daviesbacteria bacterium]
MPKQYTQGWVEFYKLRFKVTSDVLIPRPETELLVDEVLLSLRNHEVAKQSIILDLGTGSGNIAISIAVNNKDLKIIATDVSPKALEVARQNAKLHGVEDKIEFIQSDLLSAFRHPELDSGSISNRFRIKSGMTDNLIIVTNLPYIPTSRIPHLDPSVKDFEPHLALDGGKDGFELYRKLFKQIKEKGWRPKLILGEIDSAHGELAILEAQNYFPDSEVKVKTDLAHKQRILIIHLLSR